jgi:hypothetical protein
LNISRQQARAFTELAASQRDAVFLLDEVHPLGEAGAHNVPWSPRSLLGRPLASRRSV